MKLRGSKLTAALLSTALTVSMIPAVSNPLNVQAASKKKVTCVGNSAIKAPDLGEKDKDWMGNYVWYGSFQGKPVKYRVLSPNTNRYGGDTMLLDCDKVLFSSWYFDYNEVAPERDKDSYVPVQERVWLEDSYLRKALNDTKTGFYGSNNFTNVEKAAIAESSISTHQIKNSAYDTVYFPNYTVLSKDKIFVLDYEDVMNVEYGYASDVGHDSNNTKSYNVHNHQKLMYNGSTQKDETSSWYIRSACRRESVVHEGAYEIHPGYIGRDGEVLREYDTDFKGVSPAFNLDLNSIVFSSLVTGNKGENYAEYKLTIHDEDIVVEAAGASVSSASDNKISVPYAVKGASASKANQLSILILDKEYKAGNSNNANILYYGKLDATEPFVQPSVGTFEFPSELNKAKWGKEYQVYLLAEQVNDGVATDYASEPVKITKPVQFKDQYTVSFNANGGTGKMESVTVNENENYKLPECGFTAPEGKEFDKWDKGAVGDVIKVEDNCLLKPIWKDKVADAADDKTQKTTTEQKTDDEDKADTVDKEEKEAVDDYTPSKNVKKNQLKKNLKFADKKTGGNYKITTVLKNKKTKNVVTGTVTYMGPINKNAKKVTVPDTVKISGITFKVTEINKSAFEKCQKLEKVSIGKNITKIGASAFNGCSKLKSVTIKTVFLKSIGSKAFKGISKKASFKVTKKYFAKQSKMIKKAGAPKKSKITY